MALTTQQPKDFRALLQEELLERCRKNPRYSLRSFAQALQVGSSDLSKIIHKKRRLTEPMMMRMGKRLELEPEVLRDYQVHMRKKSKVVKKKNAKADEFNDLELAAFHVISDWYPLAILEMTKVKGFVSDPSVIARCLGISVNEVNIAVERLRDLKMLEVDADGQMRDLAGSTTGVTHNFTDLAKRKYQKQILEKAMNAVDEISIFERDQSSMLMAVNTNKMAEARALIKTFRRQMSALMEAGEDRDQIMFLSVSLFPVLNTKPLEETTVNKNGEYQ